MESYIRLQEVAKQLGTDKSNLLKYIKKNGIITKKIRIKDSGYQLTTVLTIENVNKLIEKRKEDGYCYRDGLDANDFAVMKL